MDILLSLDSKLVFDFKLTAEALRRLRYIFDRVNSRVYIGPGKRSWEGLSPLDTNKKAHYGIAGAKGVPPGTEMCAE